MDGLLLMLLVSLLLLFLLLGRYIKIVIEMSRRTNRVKLFKYIDGKSSKLKYKYLQFCKQILKVNCHRNESATNYSHYQF